VDAFKLMLVVIGLMEMKKKILISVCVCARWEPKKNIIKRKKKTSLLCFICIPISIKDSKRSRGREREMSGEK
jgi:hypothetical protein